MKRDAAESMFTFQKLSEKKSDLYLATTVY